MGGRIRALPIEKGADPAVGTGGERLSISRLRPGRRSARCTTLVGNRKEELELRGKLLLAVQTVREVDTADAAVCMELHSERLDVVRAVGSAGKVREVELDLVPPFVKPHGHGADEGLDARGALVIRGAETTAHLLVIEYHDLKREVLLQVLDDHYQERKLDPQGLARIRRASDVGGADVRAHDL